MITAAQSRTRSAGSSATAEGQGGAPVQPGRPRLLGAPGWSAVMGAVLAASVLGALAIGPADISPAQVADSLAARLGLRDAGAEASTEVLSPVQEAILWQLRLPRLLTAVFVGAGLALSGTVMQALTRNPLADPYLLGLSSGASLGAVSVLLLGVAVVLPIAAFAGAMAALILTLGLAAAAGTLSPTRTVLAGLAVSSAASALTSFVIFWSAQGDSYREVLNWLLGSLAGSSWSSVAITAAAFVIAGIPIILSGGLLDGFSFGDHAATALGLNVPAVRWSLLAGTALLTGAMVSVSGSIGFIGLILPHTVRLLTGARHRVLLPAVAIAGAVFMVWADTLARTVFDPREIPVGIITALIGAPVFAVLLWRRRFQQ